MSSTDSERLLADLRALPGFSERAYLAEDRPDRPAIYAEPTTPALSAVERVRMQFGLENLYLHQAEAFDAVAGGEDVVVVTGTNSGKTLCYALPGLQLLCSEPAARALLLYPTKALAQDQLSRLQEMWDTAQLKVATYDGDTPKSQRSPIRNAAHGVLSNPDMLHVGILPGHELWTKFIKSLRLIVLDELHTYRGVFGSHVAAVLRRLLRLCAWHGARPQIVGCSATIANPGELFQQLTGRSPRVISQDGSPQGRRFTVFWKPPDQDNGEPGSANLESANLLAALADQRHQTLAFSRSRLGAELVLRYARRRLQDTETPPTKLESYRSGYTPKERRTLEQALFSGRLAGLSATSAMELGVDVGALDAVVLNGYPGSVASYRQMTGRAGRGTRPSAAVLVVGGGLDRFFFRVPASLLARPPERVCVNPENRTILEQHLRCAAFERPIAPPELANFGPSALAVAEEMDRSGELPFRGGRFFYPSFEAPAPRVNLRGSDRRAVLLRVGNEELGTMEHWRALQQAHVGAVYLHRGETYLVRQLDLEAGIALLDQADPPFYTRSLVQSVVEQTLVVDSQPWGEGGIALVGLRVTEQVMGFRRMSPDGDTVLGEEELDLPATTFETLGVRVDLPADLLETPAEELGGIHGVEHVLSFVAPFYAGCDVRDLGSVWYAVFPDTMQAAVFLFDRTPGGVGLCESLYQQREEWVSAALQLLASCPCQEGCPECLLSPTCTADNENLHKPEALRQLQRLLA